MPLRDHFRPPLSEERSWEGFHGGWPMMIAAALNRSLPRRFVAEPQVPLGPSIEIDVATYEGDDPDPIATGPGDGGGVATAAWAPPGPTLAVATDLPDLDEYAVLVRDTRRGRRLVAAVEIVSPANKDRPEHRRAFVAKCSALLQGRVSVAIVDLVTTRAANLYGELLDSLGLVDPSLAGAPLPSTRSPADRPGGATPGPWRPGRMPSRSGGSCRPCRSGSPMTSRCPSSSNRVTRRRAASSASPRHDSPLDSWPRSSASQKPRTKTDPRWSRWSLTPGGPMTPGGPRPRV
jgi:Protein of unknown function (DUF4058)